MSIIKCIQIIGVAPSIRTCVIKIVTLRGAHQMSMPKGTALKGNNLLTLDQVSPDLLIYADAT